MLTLKQLFICIITALFMSIATPAFWVWVVWACWGAFACFYPEMDGLKAVSSILFIAITGLFATLKIARAVANKKMRKTTDCFHPYPEPIKDEN